MDTVDETINHAKNVGFHEKYQFFILWGLFITSTLNIGIQELLHDEHNHISYIPLFVILAIQYVYFFPKYESVLYPTGITLLNTILHQNSPFGITYRFITLYYCWFYAVQFASLEDAKTHFTFYGISSLYGLPLISYMNNSYKISIFYKYLLIWVLQLIQACLFWFGNSKQDIVYSDWDYKNSVLPILFFIFSWASQFDEKFVDINNTFINEVGKIQYGLIGMTVFISACASLCFKHISWILIMLVYSVLYFVLNSCIIPLDYSKPELTVLLSSLKYLIYQPGLYMLFTTQNKYNLIQGFSLSLFLFCIAKMIPFVNHVGTYLILLGISFVLLFAANHKKTQEITCAENQV